MGEKRAKLTDDQVREARELLAAGKRIKDIADGFGVSGAIISMIKAGKTYRCVV